MLRGKLFEFNLQGARTNCTVMNLSVKLDLKILKVYKIILNKTFPVNDDQCDAPRD